MEKHVREQLADLAKDIETTIGTLQFQVMNNIDVHLKQTGQAVDQNLEPYVKRPMMLEISRLRRAKMAIVKLANTGQLPGSGG